MKREQVFPTYNYDLSVSNLLIGSGEINSAVDGLPFVLV